MKPNKSEMKAKKNIKKWTEPLKYVLLVAAFGFIFTIATHTSTQDPVQESNQVTFTIEHQLEAMFTTAKENREVSL
jgi:hypothetical protein